MSNPNLKTEIVEVEFPDVIDLNDPDDTEYKLIDWAHQLSVQSQTEEARAVGRVLKAYIPTFCEVLRVERERDDGSVGNTINGTINTAALLIALLLTGATKHGREDEAIKTTLEALEAGIRSRLAVSQRRPISEKSAQRLVDLFKNMGNMKKEESK